ncbi:MAG: LLM class F420-dependent oxidoreductase [Candidatus Tectomicrobia bacterium]|uniref:LLM class F420-dependent oxidoreductase n=1 Tax=Tectimicrobiota bacterium TaxID=2528274 RepID=A0A937VZ16_UNCTE|nr:LLM class F420-dependent oxidoreductase [Candidatus Tectomicrobia bacterium]
MKLSVEFPSVSYREGPAAVMRLAKAIEEIGYDHIDIFDHVVMGYPTATRPAGPYPAGMPILEALMTLSYIAAVTSRVTLGTEVLVLPQREPTLVAKQVSTLDTLSGGRVRLGLGVGWQASEYEALGEDFRTRGQRMDEAIALLRTYWGETEVHFAGQHYQAVAMGMEPKPPQGRQLPIWIGGSSPAALRRVGRLGDGWLAGSLAEPEAARQAIDTIRQHASEAGRDPGAIGLQSMVAPPPRDAAGKSFYAEHDRVVARVAATQAVGFQWASLNATAIFQAGARSVAAMIDTLGALHQRLRAEVG